MKGGSALTVGAMTIIIAVAALGFIIWNTTQIAESCKAEEADICKALSGHNFTVILTTLIIAGLVLVASTVVYILVTG